MSGQMWLALLMCIAGHVLLHYKEDRLSRFAAAWIITGAFVLASGVAIPCWLECRLLRMEFSKAHAAEPGQRMSESTEPQPAWTVPVDGGVLSFTGGSFPGEPKWPAKQNESNWTSY